MLFAKKGLMPFSTIRYGSWRVMIRLFYCLPKQSFPASSKAYPCLHSHWNPPCALTHCPLLQMPCITHSFISKKQSSWRMTYMHFEYGWATLNEICVNRLLEIAEKDENECIFCCFHGVQGGSVGKSLCPTLKNVSTLECKLWTSWEPPIPILGWNTEKMKKVGISLSTLPHYFPWCKRPHDVS